MNKETVLLLSLAILLAVSLPIGNICHAAGEDTVSTEKYARVVKRLKGDQDAIKYIHRGLRRAQTEQDYYHQLFFTIQMGHFYHKMDVNDQAMSYYLQALGLSDITKDTTLTLEALNGLADIYISNNMPDKAERFNTRAATMLRNHSDHGAAARTYEIMAKILFERKQWYKSLDAAEQAQTFYERQDNKEGVIRQWLMMARIYDQNKVQHQVEQHLKKALNYLDDTGSGVTTIAVYSQVASLFKETGNPDSALLYLNKGIGIARAEEHLRYEENLLKKKAVILEEMGREDEALSVYHRHLLIQDTIGEQEARRNLQRLEVEYRTDRQKAKNKRLQEELTRKNNSRNIFIAASFILFLILVAIIAMSRYKKQRRVSATLESFNNELERRVSQKTRELEIEVEERKKISEEARIAQKKAEESDRLKTEFLQNISHEVRTPMNRISGYSDMLVEISEKKEERQFAAIIKKDSERLLKLITDIIELSQLASEDIQPNISEIHLEDFIKDTAARYAADKPPGISFRTEIPDNLKNPVISTDKERLQNILGHLIDNAFKFTKEGTVELIAEKHNKEYHLKVRDTGTGIAPEKQDIIFDYFRQCDGSSTRTAGGVGAGLTIAKHLTEILGGEVNVVSKKEEGTTVTLVFPEKAFHKAKKENTGKPNQDVSTRRWHGKNIVVLDDRQSNVEFIHAALKKTGVTIKRKHSREELLQELLDGSKADLIIINNKDFRVSEEHTAQIKAINYTIPVILLTTASADFSPVNGVADEVLTLPVSYKVLLERISNIFANHAKGS